MSFIWALAGIIALIILLLFSVGFTAETHPNPARIVLPSPVIVAPMTPAYVSLAATPEPTPTPAPLPTLASPGGSSALPLWV